MKKVYFAPKLGLRTLVFSDVIGLSGSGGDTGSKPDKPYINSSSQIELPHMPA